MAAFALRQSQELGSSAAHLLATAPKLVLTPVNYTLDNLRPFDIQVSVVSLLLKTSSPCSCSRTVLKQSISWG